MSPSSPNVPFITIQRQCQSARHSSRPMIYTNDSMKKSSSVDMIAALLTFNEGHYEDTTTCTFSSDNITNDGINDNGDVDNHETIIASRDEEDDYYTMNNKDDEQENIRVNQIASDIPTSITPISSSQEDNADDCSNDTVSTLGLDSELNDNPRSIFSNYWDGKDPKNIPATVLSRSSSHCTSVTSTSVSSSAINSDASEDMSPVHRMKMRLPLESYQEYRTSEIPRRNSVKSDMDEYEMALREYEHGRTTIPKAAALNDQRDTTIKISVIDDKPTKTGNDNISPNKNHNQRNPLHPSPRIITRRNIFSKNYSNSEANLPSYRYSSDYILQVSSTSALLPTRRARLQRHRSCLRPLGRSLSASAGNGTTGGESMVGGRVTFNPNVKVLEYDRPHIMQASDGWSKYFV